jgi:hypothetical protein
MKCTETCGNGARMAGIIIMKEPQKMGVRGQIITHKNLTEYCAVVLGATIYTIVVLLTVSA